MITILHENDYAQAYYTIMNILDDAAENGRKLTSSDINKLDRLLARDGSTIEDIADANDCGICHTWDELVRALRRLMKSGDRIKV